MSVLGSVEPKNVFKYFEEICSIPHGSENMGSISQYCMDFAEKHSLRAVKDEANNVIIYKNGTQGYENAEPIILQGHLDMVCQKTTESDIDFLKDGLEIFVEGDFVKADGTTLGADNGIAVAMVLAILESDTIPHPPIEAVFTTDEEIGMIGAGKLDFSLLTAKKMINLDAEEEDSVTVSCAGGSDFVVKIPVKTALKSGAKITVTLEGLKGGHSGVEINSGRINSNILSGRFLNHMLSVCDFDIISINGGDKSNAIPNRTAIELLAYDTDSFKSLAESYLMTIQKEISEREKGFDFKINIAENAEYAVINSDIKNALIRNLVCAPNGVMEMSAEIEGLVETSLNLGILKTESDIITLHFALRSNKKSALDALEEKLGAFWSNIPCDISRFGHYPPWEFKENSQLQKLYKETYGELFGAEPKVEAIHAGLECGIFSSNIEGIDCIAIGPALYDVHTVNEKLSISSTGRIFGLILKILEKSR